tara:strand:+ start:555 stop:1436 length:882 start_codon:yes stop_codon:yes gene_type:complete
MMNIKTSFLSATIYVVLAGPSICASESNIQIVTSFTILEDLTRELSGDYVDVVNLVPRDSDAHVYLPKPSDSIAIANADLVILNGLGFEGWMVRLLEDARKGNKHLVASDGVRLLTENDEIDPHAWQSFSNIQVYIQNISNMLLKLLPEREQDLIFRRDKYLRVILSLQQQFKDRMAKTPSAERVVVTSHDAFGYLGREFDIQFLSPLGLSLDEEASAEDLASLINQIRGKNVAALFVENISNPKLLEIISIETGVGIGGSLYSDALSDEDGPAATYVDMMTHNLNSIIGAFN